MGVHPTKREVVYLHEGKLFQDLVRHIRVLLESGNSSKTFYTKPLILSDILGIPQKLKTDLNHNNFKKSEKDTIVSNNSVKNTNIIDIIDEKQPRCQGTSNSIVKKTYYDPKNLIRTNSASQQGLLEPFLVPNVQILTQERKHENYIPKMLLEPNHKCREVDMSVPGAFASICHCQISRHNLNFSSVSSPAVKVKKVISSKCSYASILSLRNDITTRSHGELTTKIRESIFVGCISRERSLFQSGTELLMMNHYDLSSELFYQLALKRFGDAPVAQLGTKELNVRFLIEQSLQLEEHIHSKQVGETDQYLMPDLGELKVSEINSDLGRQAATCLLEKSDMLREYFSIDLTVRDSQLYLIGLPILMNGHIPAPHALPQFLLRLATEVNWEDERTCFEGICTELGAYYAEIPYNFEIIKGNTITEKKSLLNDDTDSIKLVDEKSKKFIQHTLFPNVRSLLVPPREFATNGSVVN